MGGSVLPELSDFPINYQMSKLQGNECAESDGAIRSPMVPRSQARRPADTLCRRLLTPEFCLGRIELRRSLDSPNISVSARRTEIGSPS
jgi:hypothetical protein